MTNPLQQHIDRARSRREADALRFKEHDGDLCMLCHAYGADKRSLFISCFYAIHEVVPEAIVLTGLDDPDLKQRGYYLNICKACRGRLLGMLETWRNECVALRSQPKSHDGRIEDDDPERNIPLRVNGAVVMLTREEYDRYEQRAVAEDAP